MSLPDPQMRSLLRRVSEQDDGNANISSESASAAISTHHNHHHHHVHYQYDDEEDYRVESPRAAQGRSSSNMMLHRTDTAGSIGPGPHFPRRQSTHSDLLGENAARRLSEAGVNRRPSAAQVNKWDFFEAETPKRRKKSF